VKPRRILLTPGEPAGVGPELAVRLLQTAPDDLELVLVADAGLLRDTATRLGLTPAWREADETTPHRPGLSLWHTPLAATVTAGQLNVRNAAGTLAALHRATCACLAGTADALVTGPMHKGIINDGLAEGGITAAALPPDGRFWGHTEYLAALAGVETPVMLLVAGTLRVALATTHLPLAAVPAAITPSLLYRLIRALHAGLVRDFGLPAPRILVTGLNPHAGEGGHLGREELDIILPALDTLRAEGLALEGPLPADTLFTPQVLGRGDAVLAMYHDQGLPVLKHVGFGHAVNVTLGLPFVRTSVDHGVALDLAGHGRADPGSLHAALACARELLHRRTA
jgi:4-hydroxythreonine-4-phosphate dehydrogenase